MILQATIWEISGGAIALGSIFILLNYLLEQIKTKKRSAQVFEKEMSIFNEKIGKLQDDREKNKTAGKSWNGTRSFEVEQKVEEGGGICSFYLKPRDGKALPTYYPGQHISFNINIPHPKKPGVFQPMVRFYTLSDRPNQDYYRVSIKKSPTSKGGSQYFHDNVHEFSILEVCAPQGGFYLDMDKVGAVVLIGGGIGITPMLSMLNHMIHTHSMREIWLFYGVKNGEEHIMKDHLRQIALENDNVHLNVCYSEKDPEKLHGVINQDFHHNERISIDLFKRLLPSNNYNFYICGPGPLMDSMTNGLAEWGVPEEQIHAEAFGPSAGKKTPAAISDGSIHKVHFTQSEEELDFKEQPTILELARANDVTLNSACEMGKCGCCKVPIIEGDVEYIQKPEFNHNKKTHCLTCIAVPSSDLKLNA